MILTMEECRQTNYNPAGILDGMLCAGDVENGGRDACQVRLAYCQYILYLDHTIPSPSPDDGHIIKWVPVVKLYFCLMNYACFHD